MTSSPPPVRAPWRRARALALALSSFGLGVGATLMVQGGLGWRDARARGRLDRDAFHAAVDTIVDRHVDPIDADAAYARALKHMAAGLDPHSHYLTRAERARLARRSRGAGRPGLALHLAPTDGDDARIEIAAVLPGSAAATQGLSPGDVVLSIRGRPVEDLTSAGEAEALLTGKVGDAVELVVQRRGDPHPATVSVALERARDLDVVRGRLHRDEARDAVYGVVEIHAFEAGAGTGTKRTLADLRRAAGGPLDGVVLDVRANPGGVVDEALVVADLFIDQGVLTRTRARGGVIAREERAHAAGTDGSTPLVVLQDRHSASAAELLAVALQEHGRAQVVGERSFGKGTVQEIIGLVDGSQLTLTTARYFSPRDHRIDGVGVAPDVAVPASERGPGRDDDPALARALDVLASR